jgi:hypothetical protein
MTLALSIGLSAEGNKGKTTFTLPNVRLSTFLEQHLGLTDVNDHGIDLGGVGSDLWHGPGDGPGIYWMITDRGPNGQIKVAGKNRRTFPVPEFTPFILQVKAENGVLTILQAIPITGFAPVGVTGLSNNTRDEVPFDCSAQVALPFNQHGLDSEGLVRTTDGTFWVADEYSPSILKIEASGKVLARFVPFGLTPATVTSGYQTIEALPAILGLRKINRGFEGLALSPDQRTLYAVVQSPLSNPSKAVGDASRNTRIIAFDIASQTVIGEYVYRLQPSTEFGETDPAEMKVSSMAMLDQHRTLVLERTDKVAKIYEVDLRSASDILGSSWDSTSTIPALEGLDETGLAQGGVRTLSKNLVAVLDSADGYPQKIEGMTVLDGKTIAVANDNDFGLGTFTADASCTLIDSGIRSTLIVLPLDKPLKKE